MYSDELAGDIASVASAVGVYALDALVQDHERGIAVLRRQRRLLEAQLCLEAEKLEALQAFCSDLGLDPVEQVQKALEDAAYALKAARRACGLLPRPLGLRSGWRGGPGGGVAGGGGPQGTPPVDLRREADQRSAQNSVAMLSEEVARAERACAQAKFERDSEAKLPWRR